MSAIPMLIYQELSNTDSEKMVCIVCEGWQHINEVVAEVGEFFPTTHTGYGTTGWRREVFRTPGAEVHVMLVGSDLKGRRFDLVVSAVSPVSGDRGPAYQDWFLEARLCLNSGGRIVNLGSRVLGVDKIG